MTIPLVCSPSYAQLIDSKSLIAKNAVLKKLGDGYKFTEGPVADKAGNVYFTDQPNNTILKWTAKTGEISTFSNQSGRANGMYFDKNGQLITCSDQDNQLWSFDKNGNHTILIKEFTGKLLNGPNDVWIAPEGGIYFTDPLYKRDYWERNPAMQQDGEHLYYLAPDRKSLSRADTGLKKPNGIVGTSDGKLLYVADIGAKKTYRYTIEKDGKLSNKNLFVNQGADGIILDEKGNLYLTGNGITIYSKTAEKIGYIPVGNGWSANICFGGKDKKLLFITSETAVYGLQMNVKGM